MTGPSYGHRQRSCLRYPLHEKPQIVPSEMADHVVDEHRNHDGIGSVQRTNRPRHGPLGAALVSSVVVVWPRQRATAHVRLAHYARAALRDVLQRS
jgi:hypothetical protein